MFFNNKGRAAELGTARAKRLCAGCPVRDLCLADALEWELPSRRFGVRGGLTAAERDVLYSAGIEERAA